MSSGPTGVVLNCPCKHLPAPQGSNEVCPYALPATCGGPAHCPLCRGNNPIGQDPPPPPPMPLELPPQNLPKSESGDAYGSWRGIPITDE